MTKGLITEEEQRLLQSFWVYCQPVEVYSQLANRQRCNPTILNRNLCYHREAARVPDALLEDGGRLRLEVSAAGRDPLSVLAALCHLTPAEEFVPVSCTLLHVPPVGNNVHDAELGAAEVALPPDASASTQDLVLLTIVLDAHPDLRHVKPRHGVRLTSRLTPQLAFGLLPAEAEVLWGYVPISGQVIAAQQLTSLSTVVLTSGVLSVEQSAALQDSAHTACCTFSGSIKRQPQRTLTVQVQRNAAAPQLGDIEARQPRVFYKYHYHNSERHVVEKVVGYTCSFCHMACRSFPGLRQHLEASHDLFVFGFARDHPDVVPTVNCDIAPDIYNSRGEFTQLDIEAYRHAANKEFYYACPPRQRPLRLRQYSQPAETSEQEEGVKPRPQLQAFRTPLREPVARTDSIDDSTASEPQAQTGDSVPVPAAKRKPGRMQSQLATAALRPEARYFHSRSCMPMTREEAGADLDSDDEPDTEAWRRRSREQLMGRAELDRVEKEFILNWNAAAQTKPVHGDLFVPGRVEAFAREHAKTLARTPDLRRCFINFCMILWDYCILDSATVDLLSTIVAAQP